MSDNVGEVQRLSDRLMTVLISDPNKSPLVATGALLNVLKEFGAILGPGHCDVPEIIRQELADITRGIAKCFETGGDFDVSCVPEGRLTDLEVN